MGSSPGGQGQANPLALWLPIFIIIIIVTVIVLLTRKKSANGDSDESEFLSLANTNVQHSTNGVRIISHSNKVIKLNFKGGLIGFLIDNPHQALQRRIKQENSNGWSVVQVIPDISGNLFVYIFRFILLIITLFLYTQANGYFIIFEHKLENIKDSKDNISN